MRFYSGVIVVTLDVIMSNRQIKLCVAGRKMMTLGLFVALVLASDLASANKEHSGEDTLFLFDLYCIDCHDSKKRKGDLDLDTMLDERPFVKNKEKWTSVLLRLQNKEMPPSDEKKKPSTKEYQEMVDWLDPAINDFDYSTIKDPGFEGVRRLSVLEYDNTIRDLFGIPLDPAKKFPQDLSGISGFSNSANTLSIQSIQMDKFVFAAEEVVSAALPDGDLNEEQQKAYELIFGSADVNPATETETAREVLSRFLRRAYRRDVSDTDVNDVMAHYTATREKGDTYETAIKSTLQVILISPNFLFRIEDSQSTKDAYRISPVDFANRLSYFLWASMPDEELLTLATDGTLFEPKVLAKQVDRMLSDPRVESLGTIFAAQWLGYDALGTRIRLDPIDFPFCTDSLMDAMRAETSMMVNELIRNNRPASELLTADYTYLNEELARHYRLNRDYDIKGTDMQRVTLKDSNRGGILGQGSLMAITSQPGQTNPILRGFWVLDTVLGTPPPPPPPDVDEIDFESRVNRKLTLREKLAQHSSTPLCASCHTEMDPIGLSLENFDYFGRWRKGSSRNPIDASGVLPGGEKFVGPKGLADVIVDERMDDFTRQLTRKMLSYSLGRQLEWYDETAVRETASRASAKNYAFQSLIFEIVQSYPFQYKKNRDNETSTGDSNS